MDKLKPILAHKFWILGTIALLLPPIGWWSAKGDLTAEITTRQETLQKTFDGVEKGTGPNESWSKSLAEINKLRELSNQRSALRVWQEQKDLMVWPDNIAKFMHECKYWDKPDDFKIQQLVPNRYMDSYDAQIRKLWHLVEPVPDSAAGFVDASSKRQVKLDLAAIPRANGYPWDQLPPRFEQIWGGQEDISLLTQLFQAISRVNQGTRSILESHIKVVQQVSLFGGKRGAGKAAAGDAGAGAGAAAGVSGMAGMFGSNSAGAQKGLTADINLTENFSDLVYAGAGTAGSPGGGAGGFSMPTSAGGSEAGGAGAQQQQVDPAKERAKRYIDYSEGALPFRTRGFYLKVVMDHRRIPDFLGELLNSRYPVEIVRVQWVAGGGDAGAAGGGNQALAANAGGFGAAGFEGSAFGGGADGGAFGAGLDADSIGAGLEGGSLLTDDPSVLDPALDPQKKAERIQALAQEAFADTNLATVAVAGLLTLYNPQVAPADAASAEKPAVEVSTPGAEKTAVGPSDPAVDAAAPMPEATAPPAAADPNAPPADPADPAAPPDPNADLPNAADAGKAAPPAEAPPEAAAPEAAPPEAAPPDAEKPKPEPPAAKKS